MSEPRDPTGLGPIRDGDLVDGPSIEPSPELRQAVEEAAAEGGPGGPCRGGLAPLAVHALDRIVADLDAEANVVAIEHFEPVRESPMVLSGEALVVDARVLGQEGEPILLVGLGDPTSPPTLASDCEACGGEGYVSEEDLDGRITHHGPCKCSKAQEASTITSFELAGRWFWQCKCSFFATGLPSRQAMLDDAAAHVRSGRCPFYCGDCGARLQPGSWPFCASPRNPKGHDRGHYSVQV